ncbi:unnamed protein product [Dibothriocephalus latus]|uniref:Uncharacterized protein n=1 Tax=Dibothriocephalus latus TaxID=60516 RepID=A0A3P7M1D8_DIBLA|nr:unnamed protein product [Dibothriocephalus latus]
MSSGCLKYFYKNVDGLLEILDSFEKTIVDDWGLHVQKLPSANADLRQSLRVYAQSPAAKSAEIHVPVLNACDRFRDDLLPAHGIRLQDRMTISAGATSTADVPAIGIVDASLLAAEKRDKAELTIVSTIDFKRTGPRIYVANIVSFNLSYGCLALSVNLIIYFTLDFQKEAEREALKAKQAQAKEEAGRMPPSEMFRSQTDKYSAFDDKGMPTHDASGKEVSKSQLKKLQKQYELRAKRYEAYLANKKSDE